MLTVNRKTSESDITISIEVGAVKPDYRQQIKTPYPFLSHMIEHIVWRSGVNIALDIKLKDFALCHLVCEDAGQAIGRAIAEYIAATPGVYGYGDGFGIIDEARGFAAISFEGRTGFYLDKRVEIPHSTENMNSEDLYTFLEGIAQGANATIQIELQRGENGHHIWEAIFRAVGTALNKTVSVNELRKGQTSGVAGKISYTILENKD